MKIGLFGIGLNTYWGQFDGLLERLQGYQRQIAEKMSGMGAEVVDAGSFAAFRGQGRPGESGRRRAAAERKRCGTGVPVHIDLRAVVDGAAGGAAARRAGDRAEPAARRGDRLRLPERHGRPRSDDRRVAVALPGLLGAGSGLRVQPAGTEIRHRDRIPGRGVRLGADRSVDRSGRCSRRECPAYSGRMSNCAKCAN